jgi:hypothetical protein
MPPSTDGDHDPWPRLDIGDGAETSSTLLLWTQIVGKTRLAYSPMVNHWWQVPLYLTARGLGTSPIPYGDIVFDVELDFLDHQLVIRTSDGGLDAMSLADRSVADFYAEYADKLDHLGIQMSCWPVAVEIPERVRLDQDARPRRYDADWAGRYFRALVQADRLLKEFRGAFTGKASPVHFFWGGFDLAVTRFSGRTAPPHPGGYPNVGDWVMREAYSHEVSSAGFWPGNVMYPEAAFYSYAYPEPAGFKQAPVRPEGARYAMDLGEFILPYRVVRDSADPSAAVREFLESTYLAAATLAGWDRQALERGGGVALPADLMQPADLI